MSLKVSEQHCPQVDGIRPVRCVPAAEGVESVYSSDPKLLARLGARRAGSNGTQAQTLVVSETGLLHQLLHGGLL